MLTREWWADVSFHLGWRDNSGSGLGRSAADLQVMPLWQIMGDIDRVNKRRRAESQAVRDAQASARAGRR